jgi:tRNA nucleotidyltransferase (CCA-adding enzyme)
VSPEQRDVIAAAIEWVEAFEDLVGAAVRESHARGAATIDVLTRLDATRARAVKEARGLSAESDLILAVRRLSRPKDEVAT